MLKKTVLTLLLVLAGFQLSHAGFNLDGLMDAGNDAVKAATMSDDEVVSLALQTRNYQDKANKVAPASSTYAKRIAKITKGMKSGSDRQFDIKVYIINDVNAFSLADGTIRINSMLMDKMSDDEVRYVIGHEMGHNILGHKKKQLQVIYMASSARKVGGASDKKIVSGLSDSVIGDFAEKLINGQFSQAEENDADQYGLKVMRMNNYDTKAAVSALRVLEKLYGNNGGIFASHPNPGDRANAMEKSL